LITFLRQSGGVHRECVVFGHQAEVEKAIHAAFNKAGIGDMYYIYQCSNGIKYTRRFYNGYGRNEGKKLGGAVVKAL
jgi:sortase (surface protein transpeptidase)